MATTHIESVPPVFIKANEIKNGPISEINMCRAITNVINPSRLEGVQKVRNIWRIYVKDKTTRLELCVKDSIVINGNRVPLYDTNPNVLYAERNGQKKLDKLTIKFLPLSLSSDEVGKMLRENNVKLASDVKYTCVREASGQLTSYKNGDRFVFVEPFDPPLPKEQTVANFKCLILHHGKETPCLSCDVAGHKVGDEICVAKPTDPILAFRSYQHPLSNQFPCAIEIFGRVFRSADHAYFWRMAQEFGKDELAEEIVEAKHAGVVRRLSEKICDESERWSWEDNNLEIMEEILDCKVQQCDRFKQCLLENADKVLAEASRDKYWGTGLSPYVTEHTAPTYWPGKNILGAMLRDLTTQLVQSSDIHSEHSDDEHDEQDESTVPFGDEPAGSAQQTPVSASITEPRSTPQPDSTSSSSSSSSSSASSSSVSIASNSDKPGVSVTAPPSPQRSATNASAASHDSSSRSTTAATASTQGTPQRSSASHRGRSNSKTPAFKRAQTVHQPTPSIKTFFNKRKDLASSPDQDDFGQGKSKKSDIDVS